jgi:hypothetical protein
VTLKWPAPAASARFETNFIVGNFATFRNCSLRRSASRSALLVSMDFVLKVAQRAGNVARIEGHGAGRAIEDAADRRHQHMPDGELRGRVAGVDVPGDHLRPGGCGHQEDRHQQDESSDHAKGLELSKTVASEIST